MSRVLAPESTERPAKAVLGSRPRPNVTAGLLLLSDCLALAAATGIAAAVASLIGGGLSPAELMRWAGLLLILPLAYGLADLYPGAGVSPIDEMRTQVLMITGLALVVSIGTIVASGPGAKYQLIILVAYLSAVFITTGLRLVLRELLAARSWWGVPAVVLGAGKTAVMVVERLNKKPLLNLKIVACLDDDPIKWGSRLGHLSVEGPVEPTASLLREDGVNYAIVAMPGVEPSRLSSLVHRLGRTFGKVVVIPNAFGMTSVGVGTRDSGGVVGLYVRGHLSLRSNRTLKRLLDLLLLVPLGLVALPLTALSALAVMIFSPGNPFYWQEREGFSGRRIRIWKLRTMRRNADEILARHLERDPAARAEWQTRFKLSRDPRIIPVVGIVLRRLSLDELPQIASIAKGELSFVGPRPFPYYHLDAFDPEFRLLRSSVPPGLTGYWQVTARATADLDAQVELDTYYITNWSPWLDLYVLARTPWAVLFGKGAY